MEQSTRVLGLDAQGNMVFTVVKPVMGLFQVSSDQAGTVMQESLGLQSLAENTLILPPPQDHVPLETTHVDMDALQPQMQVSAPVQNEEAAQDPGPLQNSDFSAQMPFAEVSSLLDPNMKGSKARKHLISYEEIKRRLEAPEKMSLRSLAAYTRVSRGPASKKTLLESLNVLGLTPSTTTSVSSSFSKLTEENLNNALGAIRVLGLEMMEEELKPHLCTVLVNVQERNKGAAEQVVISGILPVLAWLLRRRGPLALLAAKLVAELAKESVVRKGFGDAGLVVALLSALTSKDQDLLRHAAQAVARLSYDSSKHQQSLLRKGAVPRLVAVLLRFPGNETLEEACLLALCNLSNMGVPEEAGMAWERSPSATPGESVFRGVAPRTCGLLTSATVVHVCQWAPAQHAVSIEVVQRCAAPFVNCHAGKRAARWFPFAALWGSSKATGAKVPRRSSLRTLVFHTFL